MSIKKVMQNDINKCPECFGNLINAFNEIVCEQCGLVVEAESYMQSYQINDYNSSEFKAADQYVALGKVVNNVCTLGSHIDYYNSTKFFDHRHRMLSPINQKKFSRLKRVYSLPIKIKNHETDYRILNLLDKISQYLEIPDSVKNRAAYFYHKIKKKAKNIKNHVSLIGFCIVHAAREQKHNAPISIREICNVFRIMGHRISPKLILRDGLDYQEIIKSRNKPHSSESFIPRLVDSIVTNPKVKERIKKKNNSITSEEYENLLLKKSFKILKEIDLKYRGSRNPFIFAAAIIYCADRLIARDFNEKTILTQKLASQSMRIAEYSIRDHYSKILKPFFNL